MNRKTTEDDKVRVYLGLGSNIHPRENLPKAVNLLAQNDLVHVEAVSTAWDTPAVGSEGPDFLNAAVQICTPLSIDGLKDHVIRRIEHQLGRVRTADKNAPRTIDVDILIYNGEVIEPLIWEYAFLAVPLAELLHGYAHPKSGKSLGYIAAQLTKETRIEPRPEVLPDDWRDHIHKPSA